MSGSGPGMGCPGLLPKQISEVCAQATKQPYAA